MVFGVTVKYKNSQKHELKQRVLSFLLMGKKLPQALNKIFCPHSLHYSVWQEKLAFILALGQSSLPTQPHCPRTSLFVLSEFTP